MGTTDSSACVYGCCGFSRTSSRGALLDDAAEVHDRDAVAQRPRQAHVVGDEEQAEPAGLLELHQQVQHLCAHRHVERRHRLVADEPFRVGRQRRGDRDALALAAGQLVREPVPVALRRVQAGVVERRSARVTRCRLAAVPTAVNAERLLARASTPDGAG